MRYKKRISLEHVMCFRLIFLHCISIIGSVGWFSCIAYQSLVRWTNFDYNFVNNV